MANFPLELRRRAIVQALRDVAQEAEQRTLVERLRDVEHQVATLQLQVTHSLDRVGTPKRQPNPAPRRTATERPAPAMERAAVSGERAPVPPLDTAGLMSPVASRALFGS